LDEGDAKVSNLIYYDSIIVNSNEAVDAWLGISEYII